MDLIWQTEFGRRHTVCLARSYQHFTGRPLWPEELDASELAHSIYYAPFVVVSHGTEPDPILNYGNAAALALWGMGWGEFTQTPSRFTAEVPNREERARLLATVKAHGFIDNYAGVRISKDGRRFRILKATVWNLLNELRQSCGQAAMFKDWEWL